MACELCGSDWYELSGGHNCTPDLPDSESIQTSMAHYVNGRLYAICEECLYSPKANPIIHVSIGERGKPYKLYVRIDDMWYSYRTFCDYIVGSLKIETIKVDGIEFAELINVLDNNATIFVEWLKNGMDNR